MQESSASKTLMQGLIYPAFLGTYLVNFIHGSIILSVPWFDLIKALALFVFFGLLYLETARVADVDYKTEAFTLDIFEIIVMTANFVLLGLSGAILSLPCRDTFCPPQFGWAYFFSLNSGVIALAWLYRRKILGSTTHDRLIQYSLFAFIFCAVVAWLCFVAWSNLFAWIKHYLILAIQKIGEFLEWIGISSENLAWSDIDNSIDVDSIFHIPSFGAGTELVFSMLLVCSTALLVFAFRKTSP